MFGWMENVKQRPLLLLIEYFNRINQVYRHNWCRGMAVEKRKKEIGNAIRELGGVTAEKRNTHTHWAVAELETVVD